MHVALPKSRSGEKTPPGEQRLGFLAAGRDPSLGYVGGYLLTTARGRPPEFHYTTPIQQSATHRILYGAELDPYIFVELIAANLVRQSTIEPAFVITDQPFVLGQRPACSCPIICITPEAKGANDATGKENSSQEMTAHPNHTQDIEALNLWMQQTTPGIDLREPFARVWDALREVSSADSKQAA